MACAQSCSGEVLRYALARYGTVAERPFAKYPDYLVLRHKSNQKWYGVLMNLPRERLGLPGDGTVEVLNLKADPLMLGSLRLTEGILPGYHMNKGHWITVLLDGTVERALILSLIDISHQQTAR